MMRVGGEFWEDDSSKLLFSGDRGAGGRSSETKKL